MKTTPNDPAFTDTPQQFDDDPGAPGVGRRCRQCNTSDAPLIRVATKPSASAGGIDVYWCETCLQKPRRRSRF